MSKHLMDQKTMDKMMPKNEKMAKRNPKSENLFPKGAKNGKINISTKKKPK